MDCRFYEQKFPQDKDLVMVSITEVATLGVYVRLLEYENIEGLIQTSELSRRRIRSMAKLVPLGSEQVAFVIRAIPDQGYIELSKRRVDPDGKVECEERYTKSRAAYSMLTQVAKTTDTPLEHIYETIGWPLSRKYGNPLDAFKQAAANPSIWDEIQPSAPANALDALMTLVTRRLAPQPVKVRADISVMRWTSEGIDAIKEALRCARDYVPDSQDAAAIVASQQSRIQVQIVSSPLYVVTCQGLHRDKAIALLEGAIEATMASIRKSGGQGEVRMAPRVVGVTEDTSLQSLMDKAERENMEVDGDEASDSEVDTE